MSDRARDYDWREDNPETVGELKEWFKWAAVSPYNPHFYPAASLSGAALRLDAYAKSTYGKRLCEHGPLANMLDRLMAATGKSGAELDATRLEELVAFLMPDAASESAGVTKGRPGRRGYPAAALNYARKLRTECPTMKAAALRAECLKRFPADDLPPDGESFRRWLNRKRANRAN